MSVAVSYVVLGAAVVLIFVSTHIGVYYRGWLKGFDSCSLIRRWPKGWRGAGYQDWREKHGGTK